MEIQKILSRSLVATTSEIGKKYGRMTILEIIPKKGGYFARCMCDCGTEKIVRKANLKSGKTKSCGCLKKEVNRNALLKTNQFTIDIDKNVAIGRATNTGKEFLVDLDDYKKIKDVSWYEANTGYIMHKDTGQHAILLHRMIMDAPKGLVVDHINHNKVDNRKCNLRICTQQENIKNRAVPPKGIFEARQGNRTYFLVEIYGKYRGCFKNYEDAKRLRDEIVEKESI